jgi:hypothetical protein
MTVNLDKLREDYDWRQVFKYAGWRDPEGYHNPPTNGPEVAYPGCTVSIEPFGPDDVAEIIAAEEGENDCSDWICVLKLKDGRYVSLRAGCDYTGWG